MSTDGDEWKDSQESRVVSHESKAGAMKQSNGGMVDWLSEEWRAESSLLKADR